MNYYFMFEPKIIKRMRNMEVVLGEAVKSVHNPLFAEEYFADPPKPWEVRYGNGYPNVCYDEKIRKYRCYYTVVIKDRESVENPPNRRRGRDYVPKGRVLTAAAYAESDDGLQWRKPELGLVEFGGDTRNNLIRAYAHGAGVMLDRKERDPGRRFKLLARDDRDGSLFAAFSEDGICFTENIPLEMSEKLPGDTHNFVFYDEKHQEYALITRMYEDGIRVVVRCRSVDFINWSRPEIIFRGGYLSDQMYAMPVFMRDGAYFGLVSVFHGADRDDPAFDKVECELAFSRGGNSFSRIKPNRGFIPRGKGEYPDGEYDCGCIFASAPIEKDGKYLFYYMGGNGHHTNFCETGLNLAVMDRNRIAGMTAADRGEEGLILTYPFLFGGGEISLTADVEPGGYIKAAMLTPDGRREIDGFTFEDCSEICSGGDSIRLTWKGRPVPEPYEDYVLSFRIRRAVLYQIGGELTVRTPHRF